MKVVINHQFSKEKAIKCAGDLILTMTEKYKDEISDLKHETIGNTIKFSLKARGMKFKGEITIEDHEVIIVDENDKILPERHVGEIAVRGRRYFRRTDCWW